MKSIIETLYINLDRPQVPDDPGLEEAKAEYDRMTELLVKQNGLSFMDRFLTLRQRIGGYRGEEAFSLGFRTCARLMLEALR